MSDKAPVKKAERSLYSSKVYEDIILCAASSYFTAAFNYDFYISGDIFTVCRYLLLILMLFCWIFMSFANGLRMRKRFMIFVLGWNAGMPLVYYLFNGVRQLKFSKAGLVVKDIANVLLDYPYYYAKDIFGVSGIVISLVLSAVCLLAFSGGYIYTRKYCKKENQSYTNERN